MHAHSACVLVVFVFVFSIPAVFSTPQVVNSKQSELYVYSAQLFKAYTVVISCFICTSKWGLKKDPVHKQTLPPHGQPLDLTYTVLLTFWMLCSKNNATPLSYYPEFPGSVGYSCNSPGGWGRLTTAR